MALIDNLSKIFDYAVKNEDNIDKMLQYLVKFGYLDASIEADIEKVLNAIVELSTSAGVVNTNGIIDARTLQILALPRCGCVDKQNLTENIAGLPKWGKNNLTYSITGHGNPLTQEQWDAALAKAWQNHADICNLTFTRVDGPADINISMGSGPQDDFDGPGNVLAWCQLPPNSNFTGQLQSKGDISENWLPLGGTGRGILVENTFCHELGHGLGLSHTDTPNSLMNPFYNIAINKPQAWDIQQLQARYGKPLNSNPIPVIPPTTGSTPTEKEVVIRISHNTVSIDGYRLVRI